LKKGKSDVARHRLFQANNQRTPEPQRKKGLT